MSRVKLFALIPRRPDLTSDEFHDHYRHPHGTYGRDLITLRGYVQSHQIYTEMLGPNQSRFEAVAELWFDNERDLANLRRDPTLVKYLKEDEPKFVDAPNLEMFAGEEEVLRSGPERGEGVTDADVMWSHDNRPLSVKLLHFIAPDGNPNWASPEDEQLSKALRAFRHVRCNPVRMANNPVRPDHRDELSFLGVHELWWPTVTDFRAGVAASPDALSALLAKAGKAVTLLAQAERFI